MSDRKLKTARELGITTKERDALLRVRKKLASGVMLFRRNENPDNEPTNKPLFNMGFSWVQWECGQVGCIGGWMAFEMGLDDCENYVEGEGDNSHSPSLQNLFYPPEPKDWCSLTDAQAVRAIDRFLSGSKYPWGIR